MGLCCSRDTTEGGLNLNYEANNKNKSEENVVDLQNDSYQFFLMCSPKPNCTVYIYENELLTLKKRLKQSVNNNKNKSEENVVDLMIDLYQFFVKCSPRPYSEVHIPKDEFRTLRKRLEDVLRIQTIEEKTIRKQEPATKENSKISKVYLLNTSENRPAKSFSDELKEHLYEMCIIVKTITASGVLDIDPENVLMIICNKVERDTPQRAVDRCLGPIKENHYASMILIMLHVTRKPPRTRTQRLLLSSDHEWKYKRIGMVVDMAFDSKQGIYDCDINEEAFSELSNFFCDYNLTCSGTQLVAEMPRIGTCETGASNASNVDRQYCNDNPKPTAYIIETTGSAASCNFVREFQNKMNAQNIILKAIPNCHDSKFDPNMFLILVCSITSRLEADVDKCLSAINSKQYSKTTLVVLHVLNRKDLRPNSRRKLVEASPQKYECIFRIIDMAFNKDMGIYQSQMNTDAFQELKKIFSSHKNIIL